MISGLLVHSPYLQSGGEILGVNKVIIIIREGGVGVLNEVNIGKELALSL